MAYDAASQLVGLNRYSDLAGTASVANTSYNYDLVGRLTNLTHAHGANTLASYGLVYDAANRITQSSGTDGIQNYSYDSTNQLTGANHTTQTNEAYSYDANGNRTNGGYGTGTNNQLLTNGIYNYSYDDEGNRTKRVEIATGKVTEYVWDYRNRLASVLFKDGAGVVTKTIGYTYDGNDRRISKRIDGAVSERYVYDGSDIALVFDGAGNQTHRYLHGTQIDQVLADETQTSMVWALADNQGAVRDVLDGNGTILNHVTYDSFGKVVSQSNAGVEFRYGYTGREQDGETGLDYYRARYYDASNGRFISEDPLGFAAGDGNLTRYVGNSPTNWNDPSGLDFALPSFGVPSINWGGFGQGLTKLGGSAGVVGGAAIGVLSDLVFPQSLSNGDLPSSFKEKFRTEPGKFDPNYGLKPSAPLPARPNNTGNNAPLPQHNPNDVHNIPPFVIPQKPHTGHEGCTPDWLSPYVFNSNTGNPKKNGENLNPDEGSGENHDPNRLTGGGRKALGNLDPFKDMTVADAIKARGGNQGNVNQVPNDYKQKTVAEVANLKATGDEAADTALKMVKQASSKKQKYSGK
jgi:RHS repeat-associated protein